MESLVRTHPRLLISPFLHVVDLAYAAADLIVSRAGAMTCYEILATGKPSILKLVAFHAGEMRVDGQSVDLYLIILREIRDQLPSFCLFSRLLMNWTRQPLKMPSKKLLVHQLKLMWVSEYTMEMHCTWLSHLSVQFVNAVKAVQFKCWEHHNMFV